MGSTLDSNSKLLTDNGGDSLNIVSNTLLKSPVDSYKSTYSFGSSQIVTPAGATDSLTISSSTRLVRVTRIEVTGNSGAGGANQANIVVLILRESPNIGGTFVSSTNILGHDTINPLSTATITTYSVNPTTLGTPVLFVRSNELSIAPSVPKNNAKDRVAGVIWTFGNRPGKGFIVNPNWLLAVNFNGATAAGFNMFINIEWTEE